MRTKLIIGFVCAVLLSHAHEPFVSKELNGNLFPFVDYPQVLEWYIFSLCQKLRITLYCWLLYSYAATRSKNERLSALIILLYEGKEVLDYILFANQLPDLYETGMLCGALLVLLVINLEKREG